MDILNQRRHGSVTERLSARLDEIDPVIGRMLKNEAKLIADALRTESRFQEHDMELSQIQHEWADHERRLDRFALFASATFWQRLRWLVTGHRVDAPSRPLPWRRWLF